MPPLPLRPRRPPAAAWPRAGAAAPHRTTAPNPALRPPANRASRRASRSPATAPSRDRTRRSATHDPRDARPATYTRARPSRPSGRWRSSSHTVHAGAHKDRSNPDSRAPPWSRARSHTPQPRPAALRPAVPTSVRGRHERALQRRQTARCKRASGSRSASFHRAAPTTPPTARTARQMPAAAPPATARMRVRGSASWPPRSPPRRRWRVSAPSPASSSAAGSPHSGRPPRRRRLGTAARPLPA